jgi:hypothetical protein
VSIADFLLVLLGSGAGVSLTSLGLEQWRQFRSREDSVRHLSLRLAFHLEGYAIECANKIGDHELATDSDGHAGRYLGSVPQPPALPESTAFMLIKAELLEAILDFPQRCQMADEETRFVWEVVGDPDSVRTAAQENAVKMGEHALYLAGRIRRECKLPKRDLTFGKWNAHKFFETELKRIQELEASRTKGQEERRANETLGE